MVIVSAVDAYLSTAEKNSDERNPCIGGPDVRGGSRIERTGR
jgi:hypothetical protein